MASAKDIYEAFIYRARIFAAGVFRGTGAELTSPVDITATGRIDRSVTVIGSIQRTKSLTGAVTRSITVIGDTSEAV